MRRHSKGLPAIQSGFASLRSAFDLRRDGLGRLACDIAADGVMDNMKDEVDPDGNRWPALSETYAAWKANQFPGQPMAVLHHLLADPAQIKGIVDVSKDRAIMTYGVSEQAREEAEWFIEGSEKQNRPPRDFWGITREAMQLIDEAFDARFQSLS